MTETRRRILLVEDEFLVRFSLAETLTDAGYEVVEAASAAEALEAIGREAELSLLMTDLQLGGTGDGVAVAAAARERHPGVKVIYMTGRPDALAGVAMAPSDRVVSKPYLPSEITVRVREAFAG